MSSAWALIHHRDQVLFVRRSYDRGRGGQWCLPGGTIWRGESPERACVREAMEETGLAVRIERPLAVFRDAHYFLCRLEAKRAQINLRACECIDASWVEPPRILRLGTIMDLRRMLPLFDALGLRAPRVSRSLRWATPDVIYGPGRGRRAQSAPAKRGSDGGQE